MSPSVPQTLLMPSHLPRLWSLEGQRHSQQGASRACSRASWDGFVRPHWWLSVWERTPGLGECRQLEHGGLLGGEAKEQGDRGGNWRMEQKE